MAASLWGSAQEQCPALPPPAGALTPGEAEDDSSVEGVSGAQSVHYPGWWEGIRMEQLAIGA